MTTNPSPAETLTFLQRLRTLNHQRVPSFGHSLHGWNALEWAAAACGECGEAANVAKKIKRIEDGCNVNAAGKSRESLVSDLADEIADTIIYLDLLAAREGIDLEEAIANKFNAVSDRVGFQAWLSENP
jgi:NTP pyrophosphatase (non-canonical NTP hydrolase)